MTEVQEAPAKLGGRIDDQPVIGSSYAVTLLVALNTIGKHIYEGTVGTAEKQRRRAKNKRARAARRLHR